MEPYFDASLADGPRPADSSALIGGVLESTDPRAELQRALPAQRWLLQQKLNLLIGPADARYPPHAPEILALEFDVEEWLRVLFLPDRDWHALAQSGAVLRLMLPPGRRAAAGVSRLAQRFPQTRFLIDPFRHGPEPGEGWQSQVCLANHENVWLTTLGLVESPARTWPSQPAVDEALYAVVGEVGAGKLLFASGLSLDGASNFNADAWLARAPFLDLAQRELICSGNVKELFAHA